MIDKKNFFGDSIYIFILDGRYVFNVKKKKSSAKKNRRRVYIFNKKEKKSDLKIKKKC